MESGSIENAVYLQHMSINSTFRMDCLDEEFTDSLEYRLDKLGLDTGKEKLFEKYAQIKAALPPEWCVVSLTTLPSGELIITRLEHRCVIFSRKIESKWLDSLGVFEELLDASK